MPGRSGTQFSGSEPSKRSASRAAKSKSVVVVMSISSDLVAMDGKIEIAED
jgi:hypothetical protein